jgi:hypothetical protein
LERNAEESKKDEKDEAEQDENMSPKAASAGRVVERTEKLKDGKQSLPVGFLVCLRKDKNHLAKYVSGCCLFSFQDGFRMKREKTVVDVEVSEDKKKEIIGSLLREHTTFGMGIERERKRQEDIVSSNNLRKCCARGNISTTFAHAQLLLILVICCSSRSDG